jgi:membrane-associated phospholipid phosphatase
MTLRAFLCAAAITLATGFPPGTLAAQTTPPPAEEAGAKADSSGASRFLHDELADYRNFFSWSNAEWLGIGGLAALAAHPADEPIHEHVVENGTHDYPGAYVYGSQLFQFPLAATVWIVGHATGSDRAADTGRDLVRAQISVFSWTNAIKWSVGRTRPNGDPRGFPSGHAAASFATAAVVQEHYGWKLGVPAMAIAAYTATSRVAADEHWLSDVVFGAALGLVSGRTVTIRLRQQKVVVSPLGVPGGGGVLLSVVNPS